MARHRRATRRFPFRQASAPPQSAPASNASATTGQSEPAPARRLRSIGQLPAVVKGDTESSTDIELRYPNGTSTPIPVTYAGEVAGRRRLWTALIPVDTKVAAGMYVLVPRNGTTRIIVAVTDDDLPRPGEAS